MELSKGNCKVHEALLKLNKSKEFWFIQELLRGLREVDVEIILHDEPITGHYPSVTKLSIVNKANGMKYNNKIVHK